MAAPPALLTQIPGFDPRLVPVHELPALPAATAEQLRPAALRARFAHPQPWAPEVRREGTESGKHSRRAAVLVPLIERAQGLTVLLTQRSAQLRSHSGQIAFPGGQADECDPSLIETALREAREEVGLPTAAASVLGVLPPYVTSSRYDVTPVVALVQEGALNALVPNRAEVDFIFEAPLSFLMDPANHRAHRFVFGGGAQGPGRVHEWYSMPYRGPAIDGGPSQEWFIWGATAGMLRNFYRFVTA